MSDSFEDIIKRAYTLAADKKHEFVTLEHVLYCLTDALDIAEIINAVGGDIHKLRGQLKAYIDDPANHAIVRTGPYQPRHTNMLLHIVKKAKTQSLFSGRSDMGCVDLFLAMFNIEHSHASYYLNESYVEREAVIAYLSTNNKPSPKQGEKESLEILSTYCVNLNEKAKDGKIDPLIGRESEVETITHILARRNKNNVVMLGDPGVGKTIIVEGLAKRISEGDVPEILKNTVIYSLDIASLVAGTKFRGDFEERMKLVMQAFAAVPESVMFIDEIHMIMGAGGGGNSAMDVANLLKPALSRGEIRCIGSTTTEEYRKHFEKDRALMRRFQRVDVIEPSIEDSKKILQAIAPYYTKFHGIGYTSEALDAAVTLTARYIHNKCLPDKAIDLIDSAGARQKIKPLNEQVSIIGIKEITDELNRVAKVAVETAESNDDSMLLNLECDLKSVVFGQEEAINKLVDAVFISKSGLREGNKTLGSFLFTGPSGVGKCLAGDQQVTLQVSEELAKILHSLSSP